jgi:flagellar protein FliS
MFTPVSTRSANTYKSVGLETAVSGASPHQLVSLLFDALQQSLTAAKGAILSGDIATKGRAISRSVRILEEGLKASLDSERGGDIAANLRALYDFCIFKMTEANFRNDASMVEDVIRVIRPVSDGWNEIRNEVEDSSYQISGV